MSGRTILVTGATGAQGGGVVAAFRRFGAASGWKVRALVRQPQRPAAKALSAQGVELFPGDFGDPATVLAACKGADAVFSMQNAVANEVEHATILAEAARKAGVATLIHSSVSATGWRKGLSYEDADFSRQYWDCKEAVERLMQQAGFPALTILKPAFLMENFILPKAAHMFPDLTQRAIFTAFSPDRPVPTVSVANLGEAVFAAANRPEDFCGQSIELAGDALTIGDYARAISKVVGQPVAVRHLPAEQLIARGQAPGWVESQVWSAKFGYPARPECQAAFGLKPLSFSAWARAHAAELRHAMGFSD